MGHLKIIIFIWDKWNSSGVRGVPILKHFRVNSIDINMIYSVYCYALIDTRHTGAEYLFIHFPRCSPLFSCTCQHTRVKWRQFTKCSDPSFLWRITTLALLVQNSCFQSRILDEILMFNCTPGLVISSYIGVYPHWVPILWLFLKNKGKKYKIQNVTLFVQHRGKWPSESELFTGDTSKDNFNHLPGLVIRGASDIMTLRTNVLSEEIWTD